MNYMRKMTDTEGLSHSLSGRGGGGGGQAGRGGWGEEEIGGEDDLTARDSCMNYEHRDNT